MPAKVCPRGQARGPYATCSASTFLSPKVPVALKRVAYLGVLEVFTRCTFAMHGRGRVHIHVSLCVPGVLDFVATRFLDVTTRVGHVVRCLVHVVERSHSFHFAYALGVHVIALAVRRAPKRLCLN